MPARLVRAAPSEHGRQRHEHDLQVAREREVLDVLTLDSESFLERQLPSPEDLHRAGDPGLDLEPEEVLREVALDEVELLRPRPDDGHLATQDVDELRQLVEARSPQQPADAG